MQYLRSNKYVHNACGCELGAHTTQWLAALEAGSVVDMHFCLLPAGNVYMECAKGRNPTVDRNHAPLIAVSMRTSGDQSHTPLTVIGERMRVDRNHAPLADAGEDPAEVGRKLQILS